MTSSTNQSIKPITTNVNKNGNLEVGGCDLVELADKFGTPLYVLDEATLRSICKEYKKAFENYSKVKMMYASKAFMTKALTKIIASEDFGFDAVSGGEIYTIYKAGNDMSKVLFNGNNKSFDELNLALDLGVGRISVDNFLELSLLNEVAKSKNKKIDILLRITPGIECHTHEYIQTGHLDSKFGFDLTQVPQAIELIQEEYTNLIPRGFHAHIGSQIFETKIYEDEVELLVKEISVIKEKYGITFDEINIGGGIGVKYTEEDLPPSVFEVGKLITNALIKSVEKYGIPEPTLYLEPGRSIISTAGITLYSVGSSKQVPHGTKYWAVDGGMADNPRPSMYQAIYTAQVANKPEQENSQKVTIAGKFCESGDILIKDVNLPELEEGDILCVFNTGAYNYSMASNYNRFLKPAAVLVNNSQSDMIIERESLDDLISHDLVPKKIGLKMLHDLLAFFQSQIYALHWSFSWLNIAEVLVIVLMVLTFYRKFIKNTQSEKLVKGLFFLLAAWGFSELLILLDLNILGIFIRSLVTLVSLSLIVIFQPELRRFLGYLGQPGFLSKTFSKNSSSNNSEKTDVIKEVIEAVKYLSKSRIGALIVFQKEISASTYFDVGTKLNAEVSTELILTIFHPNTPLHDGAMVIKDSKILSAGVLLPLTEDPKLSWKYGTRHRAAIGMSEVSDSACLVVSEETGDVSMSLDGTLKKYEDLTTLKSDLDTLLGLKNQEEDSKKTLFKINNLIPLRKNELEPRSNKDKV